MSVVPAAWTTLICRLHDAQVARSVIRNTDATQQMRDDAAIRFGRALEAMFEALDSLKETGVTGRITLFLSRRERG